MVEQEAVNFEVAGSSPAVGAKMIMLKDLRTEGLFVCYAASYGLTIVTTYYKILIMKTPDCEGCTNKSVFEAYAKLVTVNEEAARVGFSNGCSVGSIACRGAIENPIFGNFCAAELEQPIVPEMPEVTEMISPASTIEEIPGYSIYAKKR